MQQDRALEILKENRQAIAEKYGVKEIGVFLMGGTTRRTANASVGDAAGIIRR